MSVLCDKSPFVVQKASGPGKDPGEADDASCFEGGYLINGHVESASTWFSWTAREGGTLTFDLIPIHAPDDIDFAMYELPHGPGNCADKVLLRCMASSCFGPTGLKEGEFDLGEQPNCGSPRQNNYLKPLDMEAGKSYALIVNNFSQTGNGFEMCLGGSGTFRGPEPAFATDKVDNQVCRGEAITFRDQSIYGEGRIASWEWDFGPGASVEKAQGQGPHTVTY